MVGRVRRAHGVRGALVIQPLSDAPGAVFAPGRIVFLGSADGKRVDDTPRTVGSAREANVGWLVTLSGLTDRTAAELLKARTVFADASTLPPPSDDEVYMHELIGLAVRTHDGAPVGEVRDVYEAPQGLLIEVETAAGPRLVPWREELFSEVDLEARVVTLIDLPGLVD